MRFFRRSTSAKPARRMCAVVMLAALGGLPGANVHATPVSASGLLGARVADEQGERLGTIRDLAVDVDAGMVRYAILEQSETSTQERQFKAVPMTALRPGLARDQLILDRAQPPSQANLPSRPGPAPADDPQVVRASTILGMDIDHPSGADYGVIHDLIVELRDGRVLHAEVRLDAANPVRREVPLSALRFPPAEGRAILTLYEGSAESAMQASRLIGMQVRNSRNGATGRIDELVVDLNNNRVHYAVLDMQNRLITEPLQRLEFPAGTNQAQLASHDPDPVAPRAGMTLVRASTLLGWQVESKPGIDLGRIVDLVIDTRSARVAFAAVRLHDAAPATLRAVPLDAFALYTLREDLVFTGEPSELAAADGFTAAKLESADPVFVERYAALAERLTAQESASTGASAGASTRTLFRRLDRDGNGFLDGAELDRQAAARRSWIAIDLDRDGRITAEEFTAMRE